MPLAPNRRVTLPRGPLFVLLMLLSLNVNAQQAIQTTPDTPPADIRLPADDTNWIPNDLTQEVQTVRLELQARSPAGSLPHEWR